MDFDQLYTAICNSTHHIKDKMSIFIRTQHGDIKINETKSRKAASVAKLFILTEAFRQVEKGILPLDEPTYIGNQSMVGGSGVISYITNPPAFTYRNLIELMVIVSDNTASNTLLDKVGWKNVNNLAMQIGCHESKINRYFMDNDAQANGQENYTSAQDMVILLKLFTEANDFITVTSQKQILHILLHQQFNDKLSRFQDQEGQVAFFHKTGELHRVEHDVAIIKYKNRKIEAAILTEGWEVNGSGQQYIAAIGALLNDYVKNY